MKKFYKIAVAGDPNCGKTTLFNQLTGAHQHTGNYPGVTVDSHSGTMRIDDIEIQLVDIPGIYSLSSNSPEQRVALEELLKSDIDMILNIVDCTKLQRELYLSTQLAELHIPMLIAFNMWDEAEKAGIRFDMKRLSTFFGAPIVRTVGISSSGVDELRGAIKEYLPELANHRMPKLEYGKDFDDAIEEVSKAVETCPGREKFAHIPARFFAIKLLEQDSAVTGMAEFKPAQKTVSEQLDHLIRKHDIQAETFMADRRYAMISGACRGCISYSASKRLEISNKIDAVLTNRFLGLPLFLVIMYLVFWFTFTCGDPLMGYIESAFAWLGDCVNALWPEGRLPYLNSLLVDGIISGVGGVIVFLPNILLLYLAISFLEDSGYMSRAAFVMDGIMRFFGLQGRSFVPLVLGFGCTVPAIMATRAIESDRDRKTTIMVLPLMSCGARLPIYALIIPVFFAPKHQPLMMFTIYLIGVVIALIGARLLKHTLFKGEGEVYLMELPPYRLPTAKSIVFHTWNRCKEYLHKAGTIILLVTILLFICNTQPVRRTFTQDYAGKIAALEEKLEQSTEEEKEQHEEAIAKLQAQRQAEIMEHTITGRVGHAIEPFFRPLGFDWRIATSMLGALSAKEIFVSQLGVIFSLGDDADEESAPLRQHLRENYTPLVGFCIMLFSLLSIPCMATLAIIKSELGSWKYALAEAAGLLTLAYLVTLIVYQLGSLLKIGTTMLAG